MKSKNTNKNLVILNKKARHDYDFIDTYVAGIVLQGTEVKSIRKGKCSLVDSYCSIDNGEIFARNTYVAKYDEGSYMNCDERRDRKLLLKKSEIRDIAKLVSCPGITVIPIKVFFSKSGYAKMEICVCKGKKEYDKRQALRTNEDKREMDRCMKNMI